jgi:hypothetical protein
VRQGLFGDLERPWRDFTLGWLDPLGAHGDYKNVGVAKLMFLLGAGSDRFRFGQDGKRAGPEARDPPP